MVSGDAKVMFCAQGGGPAPPATLVELYKALIFFLKWMLYDKEEGPEDGVSSEEDLSWVIADPASENEEDLSCIPSSSESVPPASPDSVDEDGDLIPQLAGTDSDSEDSEPEEDGPKQPPAKSGWTNHRPKASPVLNQA